MATQNAIGSNKPVGVDDGGTGAATLTDHGVLVGSGTGAITPLAVGATGTLLVGTLASDPALATSSTGDFTFTSSTASQTRILTVSNTDNTGAATSAARLDINVGGANVANPQIRYLVTGVKAWSHGIDNDDSDKFKISDGSILGTTDVFRATVVGEITKPLQPAFGAKAADQLNVTGDGTIYIITYTDAEYFDQNSDFDGTSIFTAPVTGRYQFNAIITYADIGTNQTMQVRLHTSNRNYIPGIATPAGIKNASNQLSRIANLIVDMDAADICRVGAWMSPGAKTVDILGSGTFFNGMLVC